MSAYFWMTGFGNTTFFLTKADFGFARLYAQLQLQLQPLTLSLPRRYGMLWRLNFLVLLLCLAMDKVGLAARRRCARCTRCTRCTRHCTHCTPPNRCAEPWVSTACCSRH